MSDEPALVTFMTTTDGATRDAAFLRTYAARVRDHTAVLWEIPNTVASTLEDIANRTEQRSAALAAAEQQSARYREALECLEWVFLSGGDVVTCPSCFNDKETGHEFSCALKAALAVPPDPPEEP